MICPGLRESGKRLTHVRKSIQIGPGHFHRIKFGLAQRTPDSERIMRTEADRSCLIRAKCVAEYFFVTDLALYAPS